MRLLITFLLVVGLIGGTYSYVDFVDSIQIKAAQPNVETSSQQVVVEVFRSETCYSGGFGSSALEVKFKGQSVLERKRDVPANESITAQLKEVEVGRNSIFVAADFENPDDFLADPEESPSRPLHSILVVVKADGRRIQQASFSSVDSKQISGSVEFNILPTENANHHDDHDH